MAGIRCFVAIPISSAVRGQITALIASLQSIPSDVKWEDPKKIHLTLRFLGNLESSFIDTLSQRLVELASYQSPFEITYEGLGAFPSFDRPRVYWIGVRENEVLLRFQRTIEHVVAQLGLPREDRTFHPHLTIGRVKGNGHQERLTAMVKSLTFEPVSTLCRGVDILKSELHPTGSRYTVLHSILFS